MMAVGRGVYMYKCYNASPFNSPHLAPVRWWFSVDSPGMLTRPGVDEVKAEANAYETEAKYNEAKAKVEAKLLTHTSTRLFQHQH